MEWDKVSLPRDDGVGRSGYREERTRHAGAPRRLLWVSSDAHNRAMTEWLDPHKMEPRDYQCGYCGNQIASDRGHADRLGDGVYFCPRCQGPTFFYMRRQVPGVPYGEPVGSLPDDVRTLYDESRAVMAVNAFTSAVVACRKLLMHVAVEKGAKTNLQFIEYVEFLDQKGYIPPDGKAWVDHIRKKGNEANHEIRVMEQRDAADLIDFVHMLLKFVYEFPARIPKPR